MLLAMESMGTSGALALFLISYLIAVIAFRKIFAKFREPTWKSFVPFLNLYVMFDRTWSKRYFWPCILPILLGSTLAVLAASCSIDVLVFLGETIAVAGFAFELMQRYMLARSFGRGVCFFTVSCLFPHVALLFLGYGRDRYLGNVSKLCGFC